MKKIFYVFLMMVAIGSSHSCEGELENPTAGGNSSGNSDDMEFDSSSLIGMWAQIDDEQSTHEYIKLDYVFTQYISEKSFLAHNKTLWQAQESDFERQEGIPYSLSDNEFYLNGNKFGKVRMNKDTLYIGGNKFLKFEKFNTDYYSVIKMKEGEVTSFDYKSGVKTIEYEISDSLSFAEVSAMSNDRWITQFSCKGGILSFRIAENVGFDRTGTIILSYLVDDVTISEDYSISITQDRDHRSNIDLSYPYSANCYIVAKSGKYVFKTVKGNSSTSVGSVASAEVLWESFGTAEAPTVGALIGGAVYSDDYIYFSTPDTFTEGNAVIAAKDASGTILWSWHIWLTDQPQDQVYNNEAGTMMDRNLGATSATPGDVGALGLLYQWGRKDPFLGSSSISSATKAKSTITWPSYVSSNSSKGTIEYATEHPTTLITGNDYHCDWYYTGDWVTDNTRWQSEKTIYDPCPHGYRVPDGGNNGVWSKAFGASSFFDQNAYDSTNEGFNFGSSVSTNKLTSSSSTCWYPAAGYLYFGDGSFDFVGDIGYYWSCSPRGNYAYHLSFHSPGDVYPSDRYHHRSYGFSVRCLRE